MGIRPHAWESVSTVACPKMFILGISRKPVTYLIHKDLKSSMIRALKKRVKAEVNSNSK